MAVAGLILLVGCGGAETSGLGREGKSGAEGRGGTANHHSEGRLPGSLPKSGVKRIPGVGERLRSRIPESSRQVIAVYGKGPNSAKSTAVLWIRHGDTWSRTRSWAAHNGKRGWTTDHHEGDKRSPVGVFTLSDAGGVLPDPGKGGLPYSRSAAFAAPHYWPKTHWHDFDYVIAIDYNRVKGTSPLDPTRPQGRSKGGSIWLHMDHGSGTSGCVSLPKSAMRRLLRALDPARRPVVVMGDMAHLAS
jgi:L,D-peptidoglycan transpeptidase YkuD (ErfK/YbiS/YcfS/YnhG family)